MSTRDTDLTHEVALSLKSLSIQDFKNFGKEHIAYLRRQAHGNKEFFTVYSADGEQLGIYQDRQEALSEIHTRNLDLVIMH